MRLYPRTYLSTDGLYDRAHRIWLELVLIPCAYPIGVMIGFAIGL